MPKLEPLFYQSAVAAITSRIHNGPITVRLTDGTTVTGPATLDSSRVTVVTGDGARTILLNEIAGVSSAT